MTLQRLGARSNFGYTLLEWLGGWGWEIVITTPFAGEPRAPEHAGVLVIASRSGSEIRRAGASVADVASAVFKEAVRIQHIRSREDVQRRIA